MLAKKIKYYIEHNGYNQTAIGRKAGMTKQAISDSMRGKRKLTAEEYLYICRALNVSADFFLNYEIPDKHLAEK